MVNWLSVALVAAAALVALYIWRWWHFSYFKRLGIPGPKPSLIWGNLMEYHSTDLYKTIGKWIETYGDIFGFYNGDVPFVVTLDLDLIEHVYVRNFKNFMNRGLTMATVQRHPFLGTALLHAPAPHWKSIRSSVAHGFTPAKLKLMMPALEDDVRMFLESVEQYADSGEEVNMLRIYEALAMDSIGRSAFGGNEPFLSHPDHPLIDLAKRTSYEAMRGPVHMVAQSITSFGPLMKPLCFFSLVVRRFRPLRLHTENIITTRKEDPALRKPDILQNLLEAKYVERGTGLAGNGIPMSRSLTLQEVLTSAGTLLLAGFDTLASSLSYFTFILAKYQDVQDKVRHEIQEAVLEQGILDYEVVMKKLNYLEQVMNETLRLYPPGLTFVTREAAEAFEFKGKKFKAGTCFMLPLYQIQREPRFWPDPLNFDPDRFAPENEKKLNSKAFVPFGIGPRNCIGMKIAVLNLKFTMAKLVQKYHLQLGPSQKGEMPLHSYAMVSAPGRGPWIIFRSVKSS